MENNKQQSPSSEFHKDISKVNSTLFAGLNQRMLVMTVGIVLAMAMNVVEVFLGFPMIFFYLTALVVACPACLYGLDKLAWLKRLITFALEVQNRVFQAGKKERRIDFKHDFKPNKNTKETDQIGD